MATPPIPAAVRQVRAATPPGGGPAAAVAVVFFALIIGLAGGLLHLRQRTHWNDAGGSA